MVYDSVYEANKYFRVPTIPELAPTYETDFSTNTGWTQVGSDITINSTSDKVVATDVDGTEARIYRSITLSDDKWLIDFDYKVSRITTDSEHQPIALSAGSDQIRSTSQDYLGFDVYAPSNTVRMNYRNGTTNGYGGTFTPVINTQYYVRLIRDGTGITLQFFTNSARTGTPTLSATMTVPSTVVGFTHAQITGWVGSSGTGSDWEVDNLKIYNGVTSITPAHPDIRRQRFWEYFSGSELQVSTNERGFDQTWGKDPSNSQFEVSSGRINFLDNTSSAGDRTWLDLGTNVSTTQWVLRFKFNFSTLTSGTYYYEFDAGLSDSTVNNITAQNFIGVRVLPSNFNNLWRPRTCNGSTTPRQGATANITMSFSTGTDYYCEIKRTSSSNWSISLSTTDAYDGDIQNNSYTDAGSSTGLRYFKFGDAVTNSGSGFTMQGVCDVLEFYNGVTNAGGRWNKSNSNAGYTIAMDDAVDGGLKMINNASHTHAAILDFNNKHQYSPTSSVFIYVGKANVTSGGTMIGLAKDYRQDNAYDSAMIQHDAGYSNIIQTLSSDGTSQTVTSTGYTADANYHTYQLELTSTALLPEIDGVLKASKTTNRPVDPLMPVVKSYSYSGNTTQLNIRYYEAYNT